MGAVSSANAQQASGKSAAELAEYQAKQAEVNAMQARAAAGRTAKEERRRGDIAISNAIAAGASGGGSISDPSMMNILGNIADESEYRAVTAMYAGESAARGQEASAATSRFNGSVAKQAGDMNADTTLMKGFGDIGLRSFDLMSKDKTSRTKSLLERYG